MKDTGHNPTFNTQPSWYCWILERVLSELYIPDSLGKLVPKLPHKTWPHPYNKHWTICCSNGYNGKKPRRIGANLVHYFCQPRNNVSFVQHAKHYLGAVPKLQRMNSALCHKQTALSEKNGYSLCMSEFKISSRHHGFVVFFFPQWTLSQILSLSSDWMRQLSYSVSIPVSLVQFLNQNISIASPFSLWALQSKGCFSLYI